MKIVVTSCMDAVRVPEQAIWAQIAQEDPDVLVLLGDQIYMDWGAAPGWLNRLSANTPWSAALGEDLRTFTADMHRRYTLQWAVPGFRELLLRVRSRPGGNGVLVIWDDHDFAWNNSQGGGFGSDPHGVRPQVKAVVRQLFLQFRDMVCNHPDQAVYPPLPALDPEASGGAGVQQFGSLRKDGQDWPFALLDNRWYRTAYPSQNPVATLLGPTQSTQLNALLQLDDAGLLLVFAGTPVQHRYRLSQLGEGWIAKDYSSAYPEYASLMNSRRPVLFVAGDIHHNEWGGRLYLTSATGRQASQVVQLCASAAAVGNTGPVRTLPSFGVIELRGMPAKGAIMPRLMSLKAGVTQENPPLLQQLNFDAGRWTDEAIDGVAAADDPWMEPDDEPLHVLTAREYDQPSALAFSAVADPLAYVLEAADMDGLDRLYSTQISPLREVATPVSLSCTPEDGRFRLQVRGVARPQDAPASAHMMALMETVFQTARKAGRSAVFFVHGHGKTPSDAVMQGYQLRLTYGDVEPLVFSWQSGQSGSYLKTYLDGQAAKDNALGPGTRLSLSGALVAFGAMARNFPDVNAVVLARSLGTVALANVIDSASHVNFKSQLAGVRRIVLSSAAVARRHADVSFKWIAQIGVQVVVTVNANDQTLRLADWVNGVGKMPLGIATPKPEGPDDIYLDFTHSANVGRLHDYLFTRLSDGQFALNHALLTQAQFRPADHADALVALRDQVFQVK